MKHLFLTLILGSAVAAILFLLALRPVDSENQDRVKIIVEQGWSTTQIANHLGDNDVIRSPLAFRLYVKMRRIDGTLQAGVFLLNKSQSVEEIVSGLQTGRAAEISLTIPEGFTVRDIDELLTELELTEAGEVTECASNCDFSTFEFLPDGEGLAYRGGKLEGYLYPDTYFVEPEEFVAKFFLERMLGSFRKEILTPYEGLIQNSGMNVHGYVTMASLVEEETRADEERSVVAGILLKRNEEGWGLGIDAAVRYIVNKPTEDITHGDLNVNSPYNLRKFKGLPPGPIANPGKKSFEAVLYPNDSAYWYYLHDKEGQIHYSRTNEEHNTKRFLYLGGGSQN